MGEEFHAVLKLVTGEEVFALVSVEENDGDPIILLMNPVIMKVMRNQGGHYVKVRPWMEISTDDLYVIKYDKIVTMTEVKEQETIEFYNRYLNDDDTDFEDDGRTKISDKMGYISTVDDARQMLESLYKLKDNKGKLKLSLQKQQTESTCNSLSCQALIVCYNIHNDSLLNQYNVMSKKKSEHYVNNKELLEALIVYRAKVADSFREINDREPTKADRSQKWPGKPPITNYLGECFLKIATHLSYKPNFVNYMFRDDMISDGIENCVQYIHNFDPEKSKNPFAYFTQIIHYAFLRRIQKEKKQLEIKSKIIERTGFDEVMMVDDSLLSGSSSDYNTIKDNIAYKTNRQ